MKFRALTQEEQELFKDDFINFLAANGIDGESWSKLKLEEKEKAEKILELFSDMIFETICQKQSYLERWVDNQIHTFHFQSTQVVFLGIRSETSITESNALDILQSGDFELTHSTKAYEKSREEDMFDLLNKGCHFSKGDLYKKLALLLANPEL